MGVFDKLASFGESFGKSFADTEVGRVVSPLKLFEREQLNKLSKLMDQQGFSSVASDMSKQYFAGRTVKNIGSSIEYTAENAKLATARKVIAGSAAGLLAANALGINPGGITDKLNSAAALGTHYAVGRSLMGMGGAARVAGIGYLGATAINTFRDGDNIGPM